MAEIVLGMALSHGPMLSTPPEKWDLRVVDDKKNRHPFRGSVYSYDELAQLRQWEGIGDQVNLPSWEAKHAECRAAIDTLANVFSESAIDVAVIIGDDQMEIFTDEMVPAFAVMWGDTIVNKMMSQERFDRMPLGVAISVPGYIPPERTEYQGQPALGRFIVETATTDGFDVTSLKRLPRDETPHAFGFIYRQIMKDQVIPSVPVLVNTFYPPNQPTAKRCFEFGQVIGKAIKAWDSPLRVGIFASGGLSHFAIDEDLDRLILDSMRDKDISKLVSIGERVYQSGTSEVKNWLTAVGAMAETNCRMHEVSYVPAYRTEAGTGTGMGFVYWK